MVVDIGNTNIVCAVYKSGQAVWSVRLTSNRMKTSDEYFAMLNSMMRNYHNSLIGNGQENSNNFSTDEIQYVALGSVVPELTRVWRHLFRKYFSATVYEIDGLSPLGLQYKIKDPSFIGADLVANAFAAWKKYKSSAIVIDLGNRYNYSRSQLQGCI